MNMARPDVSRIALVICALFVLVGLSVIAAVWGAYFIDSRLEASGPRADGVVLRKEFIRSSDGDSDYLVHYQFPLPTGAQMTAQRNVSRALWTTLQPGSRLPVVYAADDPRRNFPQGHGVSSLWAPALITLLFGSLAALGGAILYRMFFPREGDPS
jgi:ABC-type multidrug transport system fused ATPase/permease subunit